MKSLFKLKLVILSIVVVVGLSAQSLEPRLYSNAPTDLNFLVVGYGYSTGGLASTPELALDDPNLNLHLAILAYARGFNFFGKSAKFNIVVPSAKLDGSATVDGEYLTRNTSGLGDIKARVSLNIIGSPALKLKDFVSYKQERILGVSLEVTAPTGQYDKDKLINIGRNIWAGKVGVGASQVLGNFIVEVLGDVEFYSTNSEFTGVKKELDPIYSVQAHLIYNINRGMWVAFNSNYYWGGNTFINGVSKDTTLSNSRMGGVFAMPINRRNSIKFNVSNGISTRAGTNFTTGVLAWQYRFGGGI